jgi:toxin ParE1/3/4
MNGYVLRPAAQADLDNIWDYTEENWSQAQAERYLEMIRDECKALGSGVKIGRSASNFRAGYFKVPVGSHFIFYTKVDGMIHVMRVLHQRMNLKSRLGKP